MNKGESPINRRMFLQRSASGAGLLMLTGAAGSLDAGVPGASVNRFPYDIDRFTRTDPKLVGYEPVTRFPSPVAMPRSLAIGPDDRLHIAGKSGIAILATDGTSRGTIEVDTPVRCVGIAADGAVYAGVKDHIRVFNSSGRELARWEAPDKKTWITGLAVGVDFLYAADSASRLIWRFSKEGKLAGRIGEKNKDREIPGLIVPSPYLDVKLAGDGLLRVNNPGRHRVEVYTADGDLELFWGKPTAAIQGFCGCCNPIGLALFPDGRYITCEKGLPRVKVYGADGTFECVVAGPEAFPKNGRAGSTRDPIDGTLGGLHAAIDSRGQVCVLDLVAEEIQIFRKKA